MKFIRVDMTTQQISVSPVPDQYRDLGGRGLTSGFLAAEVDPNCHALGGGNKLVIAPGLLTGSTAPSSGRTSLGAKSPLTGTIKESNVGGSAGQYLAGHRIKALIVEGEPLEKHLWLLVISSDALRLVLRDDLAGLANYESMALLRREFGEQSSIIAAGPAGEKGASLATVAVTDLEGRPTRHAGRGRSWLPRGSRRLSSPARRPARCSRWTSRGIETRSGPSPRCSLNRRNP